MFGTFSTPPCKHCIASEQRHAAEIVEHQRIIAALESRIEELQLLAGKLSLQADSAKAWERRRATERARWSRRKQTV